MLGGEESMMELDGMNLGGVQCEICGSTEFYNEMGHYFCSVCNTQSQEAREMVREDQFTEGYLHAQTRAAVLREKGEGWRNSQRKEITLSRYEVYNYVLREILRKLVEIGFPTTVKGKAFQFWIAYLKRRKIIRVLKTEEKFEVSFRPDEGSIGRFYDRPSSKKEKKFTRVYGEYKTPQEVKLHFERRKELKRGANPTLWDDEEDVNRMRSVTQSKRQKTVAKTKAIEQEYRSQISRIDEEDVPSSTMEVNVDPSMINISGTAACQKPPKLKLQRTRAKKLLYKALNLRSQEKVTTHKPQKCADQILQPESFNLKTLYALVFIALRQVGCNVILSDLLRMCYDGTLTLKSITHFFSKEEQNEIRGWCDTVLSDIPTDLFRHSQLVEDLIMYLGVKEFRYPTVTEILPKFVDDLSLPLELECFVQEMDRLLPWEGLRNSSEIRLPYFHLRPAMEVHTIVLILIALKMLFGLDDVTERYHSRFARTVNRILDVAPKRKPGLVVEDDFLKLFVIEDWIQYLRHKREVVKSELFCAEIYSPLHRPNTTRIHNYGKVFGGHKAEMDAENDSARLHANKLRGLFQGFADKHEDKVYDTPMYTCASLAHEDVVKKFLRFYPKVNEPSLSPEPLKKNFTKSRIDFIFNPEKYQVLLRKSGYAMNVISGHASQSNAPNDPTSLTVYQPYVKFDDDLKLPESTSKSMRFLIKICTGMIIANRVNSEVIEDAIENFLYYVARDLAKRHFMGFIPIEPYHDSDTEAEEIEENMRLEEERFTGKDRGPVPIYNLSEDKVDGQGGLPREVILQAAMDVRLGIQRIKFSQQLRKERDIRKILRILWKAKGTFKEDEVFEESSSDGEIIDDGHVPRPKKARKNRSTTEGGTVNDNISQSQTEMEPVRTGVSHVTDGSQIEEIPSSGSSELLGRQVEAAVGIEDSVRRQDDAIVSRSICKRKQLLTPKTLF